MSKSLAPLRRRLDAIAGQLAAAEAARHTRYCFRAPGQTDAQAIARLSAVGRFDRVVIIQWIDAKAANLQGLRN
jgi:hypothetical protein